MYITKIEIDGFKSYGNYQALTDLDTQFNAITGLNGSGKSNILDSICFLLGISHLQYIRAENNEDLVFRKGQSGVTKATVTITFNNQDPKHKPIGYENDKEIVIRRQIVLNGKQTYHVNGLPSSAAKVSDLFNSISMNVNNPHFLIMQGRVTKVLNMKPREILLMIEEAAGVRVYEAKRRAAMTTIEKKENKMENMNKMMDEEILPRLNKLRGERDLYNEYLKLGRDIEQQERLQICLEYWRAYHGGIRYREALAARIEENEQAKDEIKQLKQQIIDEENNLTEMKTHYNETMSARETELSAAKRHKENEVLDKRNELKKNEEELKDLDQKIKQQQENIEQDKDRLKKKRHDLKLAQDQHGNDAARKQEAQKQLEQCKKSLAALERGLVADEDGNQMSLGEQIHKLKNKYNNEETTMLRIKSSLDDCRAKLQKAQGEFKATSNRRSSNNLESKRTQIEEEINHLRNEITPYTNIDVQRDEVASTKRQLLSEVRQQEDKRQECLGRYPWIEFKYRPVTGLNPDNVIGPIAKLVRLRDQKYASAIETALGGLMTNVVVRTKETAKLLLSKGGLERRVTFIPLDTIQYRPLLDKQIDKAISLVGQHNVFRAIDLIDYDQEYEQAIQYALGNVLVCTTPDAAKTVCFSRDVKTRVVTFDGDDYRPGGFLSGGSNQRHRSILNDLAVVETIEQKVKELNMRIADLDAQWTELQRDFNRRRELEDNIKSKEFELSDINEQIRVDPSSRLQTEISNLTKQIKDKEVELKKIQPLLDDLSAKLKDLEARQRDEANFRRNEEKKARKGVEEAERILKNLDKSSSNAIEQLELNRLDVETLANQIQGDEEDLNREQQKRNPLLNEIKQLKEAYNELNKQFDQAKRDFDEFMADYRRCERDIKQKQEHINSLMKTEREKINSEATFERDRLEYEEKAREAEKSASLTERQHSWITDEKEHFNKPGTQYDFRDITVRDIQNLIRSMKERREELDRRVNVEAMRSLAEEEDRANDLDGKRKALVDDRDLLQKTIYEIDAEKKRELELACKKISRDFGAIFSTILPGVTAKLQPIDNDDLTQGLQIKVAFNNQWKESLDELSGGQRSLVALSLILAMLKCNPAPIYILDEVDAALDLSHTANIGTMIKQHFKESQFIIVSLKEGMFNNANVLFRTQFVNGSSKVFRTTNKR